MRDKEKEVEMETSEEGRREHIKVRLRAGGRD